MKNAKTMVFTLSLFVCSLVAKAQEKDTAEVRKAVETQNYVFKAQQVYPQNGNVRFLTPDYDLTVSRDTIISYLPFFGRAYVAPINPSDGGIKFTSTDFAYKMKNNRNRWEIMIKPNDASEVQEMHLEIFDNGSATLRVTSTNRQNISFNGYIQKGKPKEKKSFLNLCSGLFGNKKIFAKPGGLWLFKRLNDFSMSCRA